MEHHPGQLLQAGYRQYDQQLLNAGYQPPPPPPAAGAVSIPAQSYMRDVAVGVAAEGAQMGAAAVAGPVALGLVARAMAQSAPALASAPLYAGALNVAAGAAVGAVAAGAGNFVRRSLGGNPPPPPSAGAVLPGGLGVAEVRQIFEQPTPARLERQFVVKGAPRDGAAVLDMQVRHDLVGGSAPHLDIRSLNGWNEGWGPMDRRSRPDAIGPYVAPQARATLVAGAPKSVNPRNKGSDNVITLTSSSSNDRPPPPPPGAAKIRRAEAVSLFDAGSPFAEAVIMQEQASPAQDAAFVRERSPPRGDRRPLSKRNKSREDREAARGAEDTYGQIRAKALSARSKTVPTEVFIGETPKRSKGVPPNQAQLMRRNKRAAAVKRDAAAPAEDRRVRARGGAANPERVAVREKMADNPRLYEDKSGNMKSRRTKPDAKTVNTDKTTKSKKGKGFAEPQSSRPEDRYGVRARAPRSKTLGASASRSRERVGLVV